ncbi:hypothetical protein [Nocardioides pacificus]
MSRNTAASPWPFVGMGGLACMFFVYAASGAIAPWWGVTGLLLLWVVLLALGARWWTPHPHWVAALPAVALLVWIVAIAAGAAWWGWGE